MYFFESSRSFLCFVVLLAASLAVAGCGPGGAEFQSNHPEVTRPWIGPQYWTNPMPDWQITDGRIECLVSDYNRNVHLLSHRLGTDPGGFTISVGMGLIEKNSENLRKGWAGFRVGAQGNFNAWENDAIFGEGLNIGMSTDGRLFIGDPIYGSESQVSDELRQAYHGDGVNLELTATPQGDDAYSLRLIATRAGSGEQIGETEKNVSADTLDGGLALVSDYDRPVPVMEEQTHKEYHPSFWFENWTIAGEKVTHHPDRTFGPILFSLYTLNDGIMKMTAQMPPMSDQDGQAVRLQVRDGNSWNTISKASIDSLSRTATFRVEDWPDTVDVRYRLAYDMMEADGSLGEYYWTGTVQKDPVDKDEIVVAGFTGNNDVGFPHNDIVRNIQTHDPDLLVYTGDQIYEDIGGYNYIRSPLEASTLDYLRRWYMFGWEYRELTKDIPTLALLDDHDVYHGNIWGAGGKQAQQTGSRTDMQDSGGYLQPPAWVNMAQRTQTAHFPDPYDSTPVKQGIEVYYTDYNLGGISFGILEDRKWKSPPNKYLPAAMDIVNGWAENTSYRDPEDFRAPEARLLGQRQLDFIDHWTADWSGGTWMKVLVSQTILSTVATLPDSAINGSIIPNLNILQKGDYPPDDRRVQDMDSNGWPPHARDDAIRHIRKGFAFHLAGDQHLGSTIQYGVDEWGDAGYAICVPSVANYWPRRWFPSTPGRNRPEGAPKNIGDFFDGFGNRVSVYAVSNPFDVKAEPGYLHDRAPGYGIVTFNRNTRKIHIANWPRYVDASEPDAEPYDGWPVVIDQRDNYGRNAAAYLPTLEVTGMDDPVVQVIREDTGDIVYTLRINGRVFTPKVFAEGSYTVKVGEIGTDRMETLQNVQTVAEEGTALRRISL